MPKTKTERIAEIQTQIDLLEKRQKELLQSQKVQERKDRTKRLCKRAGLLESLLPGTITLTDEQFRTFLDKTMLTDFSRRILKELAAQNTAPAAPEATETAAQGNAPATPKAADTPQGGTGTEQNTSNDTRATG